MRPPSRRGELRIGLIGAGAISSTHASALEALDGTNLVAVCDLIDARASALADQFGIANVFHSAHEMLQNVELDAVHVLTPPQFHVDAAIAALRADCHVLVEKPLVPGIRDP
jgi:predicted dehydrogenase